MSATCNGTGHVLLAPGDDFWSECPGCADCCTADEYETPPRGRTTHNDDEPRDLMKDLRESLDAAKLKHADADDMHPERMRKPRPRRTEQP